MGLRIERSLELTGLTRHQYYYRPKKTDRRGRPKSKTTLKNEGGVEKVYSNESVVDIISNRQKDPDLQSGYKRMCSALMLMGFIINPKKVYRLMNENQLLLEKPKASSKEYARYRILTPTEPLTSFEMDIKQVYCTEKRRYAYVLSIIDTFTRVVLFWEVRYNMKHQQVAKAWQCIIEHIIQPYHPKSNELHIEVRNDNGPQFSAKKLRSFFEENGLSHVFTHPYTPQENGHIESFHSILSKSLEQYSFWSIEDLEKRLDTFYHKYNNERIHGSTAQLNPILFWRLWDEGKIQRQELSKRKIKFTLIGTYQQLSGNTSQRAAPCLNLDELDAHSNLNFQKVEELVMKNELFTLKNNHRYKTSPSIAPCQSKNMEDFSILATGN